MNYCTEGPQVTTTYSCHTCKYLSLKNANSTSRYADWICKKEEKPVEGIKFETPDWCPFLKGKK